MTRIVAACAAALFLPLLALLATGRVLTIDDLSLFHVPVRLLYAQALAAGDSFTWTPALASGLYLHGEGQVGMFHPLHLALYSTLPFEAAFNLEIISSYVFMLFGAVLMFRRMGLTPAASWFGAMAHAFSGFNLMRLLHINTTAVAAHLPWLVLAAECVVSASSVRGRAAGAAGFALAVGSMLLLGYPQYVFISGVAVVAYAIWRAASVRAWSRLAWLAAAFLCGVGIGALQMLPTLSTISASERGESSIAFALTYSLHPLNLLQLVTPYVFRRRSYMLPSELSIHENAVYTGAFCTLAVCWAIARWRDLQHRALAGWALAVAAVATVLALGRYAGVSYALAALPVVGWFRGPSRFVLVLHFALAIVAAIVFDDLLRLTAERRRSLPSRRALGALAIPVIAGALVALAAFVATGRGGARGLGSIAVMMGTAMLVGLSARGHRIALMVIPAVFALDVGWWGYRYLWYQPPASVKEIALTADVPSGSPGELLYNPRMSNVPVLQGYRVSNAYVALLPRRVLDPAEPIAQRLAGVAWRRTPNGWERVQGQMARVRLVGQARASTDPKRDIETIDINRVALVEGAFAVDGGPPGDAKLVADRPGRIVVEAQSPGRGVLVTTERYHAGWSVTADGRSVPTIRVNGDFLGCPVDPGRSTIALTFLPGDLRVGTWLTVGSSAIVLALYGYVWISRKKARESS